MTFTVQWPYETAYLIGASQIVRELSDWSIDIPNIPRIRTLMPEVLHGYRMILWRARMVVDVLAYIHSNGNMNVSELSLVCRTTGMLNDNDSTWTDDSVHHHNIRITT